MRKLRKNMGGTDKSPKFFRFRSPVDAFAYIGELERLDWALKGFELLDFSWDVIVKEIFLVSQYSYGGIPWQVLISMPMTLYEKVIEEAVRIQKMSENEEE